MNISDLNYLEPITETANIQGAGNVFQFVAIGQAAFAGVGGAGQNSIGNTALGLNLAIPTVTGVSIL
ncbi:MAG: hypothetical protein HC903_02280 [Methylacidiphilales bacterium]|nr:hypothetical protein [Candidatus Methylacidiphilales bacterium]NJR16709.1 hypothetical protein [Calothrix sp. CSU_2_0]